MVQMVPSTFHRLCIEAEQAALRGDLDDGTRKFIAAGDQACRRERWHIAAHCYRSALELDLASSVAVTRLIRIGTHMHDRALWVEYARTLKQKPAWSQFTCRRAQLLVHNLGSIIECADVGPVMELVLTADGRFECLPDGRFSEMPLAMLLIIVRRALWPTGKSGRATRRVRVGYRGRTVWLDARGDWSLGD